MARGIVDRFEKFIMPVPWCGCWLWTGASLSERGRLPYGKFRLNGRMESAHRAAWTLYVGPIPKGLFVLHRCDVPFCVNPSHLFLGTALDNMRDKINKGRHQGAQAGELHHNAKLTRQQVELIRASSAPQRAVARQYGVSQTIVSQIKQGKRWKENLYG